MSTEKQFCTFFVDGLLFGVEVLCVQEIMAHYKLAPVPLASSTIAGLVNHRGQIVTAIDMRRRLEVSASTTQSSRMLVVRSEDETFGLMVDKIGDVLTVSSDDFEAAPENVNGNARDLVEGTYKLANRLLLPLRLDKIAEIARQ